ncbi:hypothetical protein Ptr902_02513 [Pyrenophora tritici-repentis]|uniref:Uncharacterized protein n=1 Tax=Pyrenophora tritici-repentis TaxID=45151 RepID=A0A5M9L345_9PLEO|nr:hypothetical protein PtrV1_09112 [Pyrenophora tritici-repentis]KAF7443352.1 hypothetical protein A1F99_128590 [Pyrenophora tritici-repentis]KAF7568158.1 hypothetical protein PtrM4_127710 [Pyrenophora tritici-repentis]KAI0573449.1 hypothetical protein Alg215_09183 [Pyrenophora tritici-repentis]KAI0581210.1 hypothetical protein Alg130_06700 [Pyrenophora tritici-repentis]
MRLSTILATLLATLAVAYPDPTPQGYSGPCTENKCGINGNQCGTGQICVGWPHTSPALRKGCACSTG